MTLQIPPDPIRLWPSPRSIINLRHNIYRYYHTPTYIFFHLDAALYAVSTSTVYYQLSDNVLRNGPVVHYQYRVTSITREAVVKEQFSKTSPAAPLAAPRPRRCFRGGGGKVVEYDMIMILGCLGTRSFNPLYSV